MKLDLSPLNLPAGWCTYMLICIDGSYYVGLTNIYLNAFKITLQAKVPPTQNRQDPSS